MSKWRKLANMAGLGQKRCANCLSPFFPDEIPQNVPSLRLCGHCQNLLQSFSGIVCSFCGNPASSVKPKSGKPVCGNCLKSPPPWKHFAFFGIYSGLLQELVLRLKFSADLQLAHLFADFLFETSHCLPGPDVITAVPQTSARLFSRGYNQAWEIAKALAVRTRIPASSHLLKKIRQTVPQEGLSALERRKNLKNAFIGSKEVGGKKIWLIDDVMTSGATLREAGSALMYAGAESVSVLFVCRTSLENP